MSKESILHKITGGWGTVSGIRCDSCGHSKKAQTSPQGKLAKWYTEGLTAPKWEMSRVNGHRVDKCPKCMEKKDE